MTDRKIEEEAVRLQKSAVRNNTHPIWDYRSKLRTAANARNIATKKDGAGCQRMGETAKRRAEWTEECF